MKTAVIGLLSLVALALAAPAAADAPSPFTFVDVFPDVNPCTGTAMTVTITVAGDPVEPLLVRALRQSRR